LQFPTLRLYYSAIVQIEKTEDAVAWTTPVLVEICIGLEINGYMPADGSVPPEF
jgi:coenzyme PQQ precursor peptide PqqA